MGVDIRNEDKTHAFASDNKYHTIIIRVVFAGPK